VLVVRGVGNHRTVRQHQQRSLTSRQSPH